MFLIQSCENAFSKIHVKIALHIKNHVESRANTLATKYTRTTYKMYIVIKTKKNTNVLKAPTLTFSEVSAWSTLSVASKVSEIGEDSVLSEDTVFTVTSV